MRKRTKYEISKLLLLAVKIGIGGSVAYFLAELLQLQFASSAGIIALLTLQTTKWETVRLSVRRLISFFLTFVMCFFLFHVVRTPWLDYGLYLIILVLICETLGWRNVISANAVIATHFLSTRDFSKEFLINELSLVLIGISVAIFLNLFHINGMLEERLVRSMRQVEHGMKKILKEMSGYLKNQSMEECVWEDIKRLEKDLEQYLDWAHEYQNNTLASHPEYYINYFRMRREQCEAMLNLHKEVKRISELPREARIVSEYLADICEHVTEMNNPMRQIAQLEMVTDNIKNQPLPETQEALESIALLYHILMELEDFLLYKKRFIESIDEVQFRVYWKREVEGK